MELTGGDGGHRCPPPRSGRSSTLTRHSGVDCQSRHDAVAYRPRLVASLPDAGSVWSMPQPHGAVSLPLELSRLLSASETSEHDKAWETFLTRHNGLLLHTCRHVARDRDAAMDGYAYVLEQLRADGYRRLRAYTPQTTTRFTTWLVVVTRRLLLDFYRHRYGRSRSESDARRDQHAARRRLEDLVGDEIDPEELPTAATHGPDAAVRRAELARALRVALDELDPSDRLLLALRFEDERPVRDIAAVMRLPSIFHVYRRLGAVLTELKRRLARRGITEPEP